MKAFTHLHKLFSGKKIRRPGRSVNIESVIKSLVAAERRKEWILAEFIRLVTRHGEKLLADENPLSHPVIKALHEQYIEASSEFDRWKQLLLVDRPADGRRRR